MSCVSEADEPAPTRSIGAVLALPVLSWRESVTNPTVTLLPVSPFGKVTDVVMSGTPSAVTGGITAVVAAAVTAVHG
jgi:hypothetical protein